MDETYDLGHEPLAEYRGDYVACQVCGHPISAEYAAEQGAVCHGCDDVDCR